MEFEVESREDLHDEFIKDYAARQPGKNVSEGSDPYRLSRTVSGVGWAILAKLLFVVANALPDKAKGWWLDRWGKIFQFPKKGAATSAGVSALRVTGPAGTPIPADLELTHQDGTLYKTTSVGAVVGGGGTVDVDVASVSTGLATNKVKDEILTFSVPPGGVTAAAVLVADLVNGRDKETDEEYRPRLLAHIGSPPSGGAIHDWEEWALSIVGVSKAYIWKHRRGRGTIDVAVLGVGTGAARIITSTDPLEDYIDGVRPGNMRDWKIILPVATPQNVRLRMEIDEKRFKWDWDDAGVSTYLISAFDAGAKTITVPTAPVSVVAGKRLTLRGEEAKVTLRAGDVLTLEFASPAVWFSFAITTGVDFIRASGDLVVPTRNAIINLLNQLGPARSSYSANSWEGNLKLSKLYAAATDVDGVDDGVFDTPAANVVPVDEYGATVPLLTPGVIEVWKKVA